jgi:hypothetical protein
LFSADKKGVQSVSFFRIRLGETHADVPHLEEVSRRKAGQGRKDVLDPHSDGRAIHDPFHPARKLRPRKAKERHASYQKSKNDTQVRLLVVSVLP